MRAAIRTAHTFHTLFIITTTGTEGKRVRALRMDVSRIPENEVTSCMRSVASIAEGSVAIAASAKRGATGTPSTVRQSCTLLPAAACANARSSSR